jgi:hypothetical protein
MVCTSCCALVCSGCTVPSTAERHRAKAEGIDSARSGDVEVMFGGMCGPSLRGGCGCCSCCCWLVTGDAVTRSSHCGEGGAGALGQGDEQQHVQYMDVSARHGIAGMRALLCEKACWHLD